MSITISSKRPGVFSDYTVSSIYRGESSHAAALVCEMTQETGKVAILLSSEDARKNFPAEDTLCACCDILFANGVGKIYLSPLLRQRPTPHGRMRMLLPSWRNMRISIVSSVIQQTQQFLPRSNPMWRTVVR